MRHSLTGASSTRWIAALLALAAGIAWAADASRVPKPVPVVAVSGKCVDDPQVMRVEHMNMLRHDRDKVVHQGVRKVKASFKECIDCHASPTTGSAIGSRDGFCQGCHDYVGIALDCFECHSSKARVTKAEVPARVLTQPAEEPRQ